MPCDPVHFARLLYITCSLIIIAVALVNCVCSFCLFISVLCFHLYTLCTNSNTDYDIVVTLSQCHNQKFIVGEEGMGWCFLPQSFLPFPSLSHYPYSFLFLWCETDKIQLWCIGECC